MFGVCCCLLLFAAACTTMSDEKGVEGGVIES